MKKKRFKKTKAYTVMITAFILMTATLLTVPAEAKYPAEKKSGPDYYSRDAELDHLGDLFFPHDFQGDLKYDFSVPSYLKNSSYGHQFLFKDDYGGFNLAPFENESDLPPDYVPANFSIQGSQGDYIYSEDNKRTGVGGGSVEGIEFSGDKVKINNTGGCEFFMFKKPDWDDIIHKPQTFSFTGRKRSFMLWGVNTFFNDIDRQEKYVKINMDTDKPVRAYAFDNTGSHYGELIDFDEERSKSKELDFVDQDKKAGVSYEPVIGFSTIDGKSKQVNITLEVEIKDLPENLWLLPVIVGGVFVGVVGASLWITRKES